MMAAHCSKFPAWCLSFVSFVFVSLFVSALSQCQDGTYEHKDAKTRMTCCLCGAGFRLEQHCTSVSTDRKCTPCASGTFNNESNYKMTCEGCTSCEHENDNLEEVEPCTSGRDRTCRCKKDHYCVAGPNTTNCRPCQPCTQCGPEGIKIKCTNSSDTVCNDKREGKDNQGIIIGVLVAIAVLAVAALVFWFIKKKKKNFRLPTVTHPPGEDPAEMETLRVPVDLDLQPHLPAIAELIGWNDMKNAAMRGNIPETCIENCALNHPHDHSEQALELLGHFVQHHGSGAPNKLIQILLTMNRRAKAENLKDMLCTV